MIRLVVARKRTLSGWPVAIVVAGSHEELLTGISERDPLDVWCQSYLDSQGPPRAPIRRQLPPRIVRRQSTRTNDLGFRPVTGKFQHWNSHWPAPTAGPTPSNFGS